MTYQVFYEIFEAGIAANEASIQQTNQALQSGGATILLQDDGVALVVRQVPSLDLNDVTNAIRRLVTDDVADLALLFVDRKRLLCLDANLQDLGVGLDGGDVEMRQGHQALLNPLDRCRCHVLLVV